MFESIDDDRVVAMPLCSTPPSLGSRARGRDADACGPIDYSMSYPCGLLVEGFDTPPRAMMSHNPSYYGPSLGIDADW